MSWTLQQSLAGLNGAKIINLGGMKNGQGALPGGMGSLDDLAAQLGAIDRQGEVKKPRVKMLKDGKYQVRLPASLLVSTVEKGAVV